ncbi:pectin lyase-like protein, partial [Coniochaeta ligniaria NRRL 30616]
MNELGKRDSTFWMASMNMNGRAPYGGGTYTVFRNVKDYGAVGDGIHDDTAAINNAVTDGGRCGMSCGSSTAKPAVIYFPTGTYLVSASIIQYYNTQFLGDPTNRPIILAASSFSGLGVISSDVYIDGGSGAEYVPQNNFLRSVRNFIVDITNTPSDAYVCGIHWQVAQGTDLQNIDFYMKPGTTQQGIYMENGSGGFLSDLYFYGGNFGAYLGNQQFTSRNLLFHSCLTAIQIHWDWAWTMQGITIIGRGTSSGNPSTGITIVGGGVGSFILLDSTMSQLTLGISTTLLAENSTSLLLQNFAMSNVVVAVQDSARGTAMLAGGASVSISSWGFGNIVTGESGTSSFQNGNGIPAANRSSRLTAASGGSATSFFARSAPTYKDVAVGGFMNIKSYGAKGDGTTDDTAIINQVLAVAANASQIVFFPYGMYMVSDMVRIPLGSRIVGQVWPQIVATGSKFEDMRSPRPVVQVGVPGDVGTVEISDIMVSVRGPTAGAVLMEWNVHEETQGSAALWNTHLRVGGNLGSSLQAADCPKLTGSINPNCAAASLLLHLTPTSSAYVENLWAWVADHDIDIPAQTQIDIYSGRGILIESQGPSWFWGTASEHSVMYQYQLSNARDIFFSMIQTESPYFQPGPKAPAPFAPGVFPADPDFTSCSAASTTCAFAWALRMLDSSSVYIYSSGLYSWFSSYSQACVDAENCQDRGVDIENSSGVWMYALTTKALREMVSPVKAAATMAAPNQNGYLSSILAWLEGSTAVVGSRFPGWSIFPNGSLADAGLTTACEAAMYQTLKCDVSAKALLSDGYQGNVGNATALSLMCDPDCYDSLRYLHGSIVSACASTPELLPGWPLVGFADMVWAHWNETCFKDPTTGQFCDSVLSAFSTVSDISQMPRAEMCSYCNLQKYDLMRTSAFSVYDNTSFETRYRYVAASMIVSHSFPSASCRHADPICTSHQYYTSVVGDTCDSVAVAKSVSSATLFWINPSVWDCSSIPAGTKLCLPLACPTIHTVTATESCLNITTGAGILTTDLSAYNPGLNWDCDNLHNGTIRWGLTLCISPPGGGYTANSTSNSTANPWTGGDGYHDPAVAPPPGAVVAAGTTTNCGDWYKHTDTSMSCAQICLENQVTYPLFLVVNPSLHSETCSADLVVGATYCIHPTSNWNTTSS